MQPSHKFIERSIAHGQCCRLRVLIVVFTCVSFWVTPGSQAALVLDQTGPLTGAGSFDFSSLPEPSLSQIFTDFPDSSATVLENFTATSGQLNVTGVSVVFRALGGFADFSNVQGFALNVFSNISLASSSLTGDVASLMLVAGSGATLSQIIDTSGIYEYGLLALAIDFDLPSTGEYWVGVSPVGDHNTIGQFMVLASPSLIAASPDARLANPGGELGAGLLSLTGKHHAYSVTAVPEPGTLSFWILGAGWWLSRRSRRAPSAEIS